MPLDEPRREERTVAGADIWAGLAAFIVAGWLGFRGLFHLNDRLKIQDDDA